MATFDKILGISGGYGTDCSAPSAHKPTLVTQPQSAPKRRQTRIELNFYAAFLLLVEIFHETLKHSIFDISAARGYSNSCVVDTFMTLQVRH